MKNINIIKSAVIGGAQHLNGFLQPETLQAIYKNCSAVTTLEHNTTLVVNGFAQFTYTGERKDGTEYEGTACIIITHNNEVYKSSSKVFMGTLDLGVKRLTISEFTPEGSKWAVKCPRLETSIKFAPKANDDDAITTF